MEKTMLSITTIYDFIYFLLNIIFSWQVVTLLIVLILRKPLIDLLSRIEYFKYNNTVISFSKNVDKIYKFSELIKLKDKSKIDKKSLFMERVYSIAKISPASVIFFAYHEIENTFTSEYEIVDDEFRAKIIDELSLRLYEGKLIKKEKYELFNEMTKIYNTVLNDKNIALSINKKTAIKYGRAAKKIIDIINELKKP